MRAAIRTLADVLAFRSDVRRCLQDSPLAAPAREEVLLALTELGTNLVLHAGGGEISVETSPARGLAVRVASSNAVPESLLAPGLSPAGLDRGLGIGLSSLGRLMDRVDARLEGDRFLVVCEKDVPRRRRARA
jgi:anti-sigma regulatory factor (Ser/Thr protein kinase)